MLDLTAEDVPDLPPVRHSHPEADGCCPPWFLDAVCGLVSEPAAQASCREVALRPGH